MLVLLILGQMEGDGVFQGCHLVLGRVALVVVVAVVHLEGFVVVAAAVAAVPDLLLLQL